MRRVSSQGGISFMIRSATSPPPRSLATPTSSKRVTARLESMYEYMGYEEKGHASQSSTMAYADPPKSVAMVACANARRAPVMGEPYHSAIRWTAGITDHHETSHKSVSRYPRQRSRPSGDSAGRVVA